MPKHEWTNDPEQTFLCNADISTLGIRDTEGNSPLFALMKANDWAFAHKIHFSTDEARQVLFAFFNREVDWSETAKNIAESFDWYELSQSDYLGIALGKLNFIHKHSFSARELFNLLAELHENGAVRRASPGLDLSSVRSSGPPIAPPAPGFTDPSSHEFFKTETPSKEDLYAWWDKGNHGCDCPTGKPLKPDTGVAAAIARTARPRPSHYDPSFDLE